MNLLGNIRDLAFSFIAEGLEKKLSSLTFKQNIKAAITNNVGSAYLKDLSAIKAFIISPNLSLIFDLPWVIIFLAVIFYIHWILGFVILGFTITLAVIAFLNQKLLKIDSEKLNDLQLVTNRKLELLMANSEVIVGMAMTANVNAKYNQDLERLKIVEARLKQKTKTIATTVKTIRYGMQIAITFISALLIIQGRMSSGGMIAISILSGKVLAPFDASAAIFQSLVALNKSYQRLLKILPAQNQSQRITLPVPYGEIRAENLSYYINSKPIIKSLSFAINSGEVIGIIGKSASGKTTLARLLSGILQPSHGRILLDETPLYLWPEEQISQYLGYLPQDVELFHATIKDNISRFDPKASDQNIIEAAIKAGVHQLIMSFNQGYETEIGSLNISAGQRQRIALARAFYGNPKIIILDEPNSSLDLEGESALLNAVNNLKKAKDSTILMISHKPSILSLADRIMVIEQGEIKAFDETNKIIGNFINKNAINQN